MEACYSELILTYFLKFRLRQPYHHQVGCQDAHCRNHHRSPLNHPLGGGSYPSDLRVNPDQPLDCRATAAAAAAAAAAASSSTSAASAAAVAAAVGASTSTGNK